MPSDREPDSFYYRLGKRIGWWYAENRHTLHRSLVQGILYRLPGGRWISQFFR